MSALDDEALPALFRASDAASVRSQKQFFLALAGTVCASVLAATFGAVSAHWAGYAAAAAFLAAIGCSYFLLQVNPERAWYDGRAVAESVKTLAWQYAVGGGEFARTAAGPSSSEEQALDQRFVEGLAEVRRGLGEVAPVPLGSLDQLTDEMRALRAAPLDERRRAYLADRIDGQANWYADKSRKYSKRRIGWGRASAAFQVVGLLGAIAKGAGVLEFDLLGVAAAAALGIVGWNRAKDFAELSRAYGVTAIELGEVKVPLRNSQDDAEWAVAVRDAESAISREHTRWAARRHHRLDAPTP